jgi:hypothetical protein
MASAFFETNGLKSDFCAKEFNASSEKPIRDIFFINEWFSLGSPKLNNFRERWNWVLSEQVTTGVCKYPH